MLHLIADPAYKRGVSSALDCDADAASGGERSDELVLEVWDASGAKR